MEGSPPPRCFDVGSLILDIQVVFISQVVLAQAGETAADRRSPPRPDEHHESPRPQTGQEKQRAHSPGNPKHAQEGTQLVRPEVVPGLAKMSRRLCTPEQG